MLAVLNIKIKDLSDRENNLLQNEKWGVFPNITKVITGVDGCKSTDDLVKCESCLTTINYTLKSSADFLSFIDSKRKFPYREDHKDHTPKPFASHELKFFQEAKERVKVLHEKLQEASNKLATTLINLKRKFPSRTGKDRQSRRKKENKRKVKKIKGEAFTTEGTLASRKTHLKRGSWRGV